MRKENTLIEFSKGIIDFWKMTYLLCENFGSNLANKIYLIL